MKIRIFLKSFNKKLINIASNYLKLNFYKINLKIENIISLPKKFKNFCVIRSPHIDKDSREEFELCLYKKFIDIKIESLDLLDLILKIKFPIGVSCNLKIL